MPTGFGVPPDAAGNGTTPEDIQRITAATYENAGILTGCKVFTRSDWKYLVTAGAVVVDTGSDLAVEVPVDEVLLDAPAAPTTGTAVHTIYVVQDFPGSTGSSLRRVVVTTGEAPAGAIVLDRRTVSAGQTATTATTSTWDRRYAMLSGASLGMLSTARDTDTTPRQTGVFTRASQRINVPTDRWLDIRLSSTISRANADGSQIQGNLKGSAMYRIYIDGALRKSFEREFGRVWNTEQFTTTEYVSMGAHTIHYTVERQWTDPGIYLPNDYWAVRYGGPDLHHGDALTIFDRGVHV